MVGAKYGDRSPQPDTAKVDTVACGFAFDATTISGNSLTEPFPL